MNGLIDRNKRWEDDDRKYLWHPFTQMKEWLEEPPLIIIEGRGNYLKDAYGRWYLDGVSSLWCNIHGHRRKEIDDAIKEQLENIAHSTLLGLSNVPAIELAEKLVQITPKGTDSSAFSLQPSALTRVFYSDNGSTTVEIAIKMAFQYWQNKGQRGRTAFLSLNNAYHGDTIGAVSVGGIEIFHSAFKPLLFPSYRVPSPYCYRCELGLSYPSCAMGCLEQMEELLKKNNNVIAAVIIEPVVQGAGGMIVAPEGYLKGVCELCTKYNVLLIVDEVATAFGRTGKMFACEHENVSPDIMCVAKGITGGYLPLAATITTEEIFNAFLSEYTEFKTFFHGHTYTGNPLACAAAIVNLEIFEREKTLEHLQPKIALLSERLKPLNNLPLVGEIRQKGFMVGIELVADKETKTHFPAGERVGLKVIKSARENGLIIRPLGDVIVLMPPLSVTEEEIKRIVEIVGEAIRKLKVESGK
ncbi:MAG: adenosylmethionine--8-amino-7-oxononanoate transaminase [Nitrospirota bacterium]